MLRFPYQQEWLTGPAPPSLPPTAKSRWRPLVPVAVRGPGNRQRFFTRAVLDPAADDTVFPLALAGQIGVRLMQDTGHAVRWRGQSHPLRFAAVQLELSDGASLWRWSAIVGFSPAMLRYPILGNCGCLDFIDARYLGRQRFMELETNSSFPGTTTCPSSPRVTPPLAATARRPRSRVRPHRRCRPQRDRPAPARSGRRPATRTPRRSAAPSAGSPARLPCRRRGRP
jgi:hypothetical protein